MDGPGLGRRELLAAVGASAIAGCSALPGFGGGEDAPTTPVGEARSRELATRFAPTVYFDADETFHPTDPRTYTTESEGMTVVPGFDALDGYVKRAKAAGAPPDPSLFYHVRSFQGSPLAVVQYWSYAAFDQFTTNFHWHDWEVLHVYVDEESDEPQLYVASAHDRMVPNNEFLDPGRPPVLLSELGSHSSAISINDLVETFQRVDLEDTFADVTNAGVDTAEKLVDLPIAYGLPRDEGMRLPYVVPALDGAPLYEHPRLPNLERSDLAPPDLTVRSFADVASPPSTLPARETGLEFGPDDDAEVTYDLLPSADLEHIAAFHGPQLEFEFDIPQFAEDALASHLTVSGAPWNGKRYWQPASDITDPVHRSALSDRYDAIDPGGPVTQLVGAVRRTVADDDAPEGEGVTTAPTNVEAVALLESEPAAIPTFGGGVVVARDVPAGDHRLTVNGAGMAPYSERVTADGTTLAGVEGRVAMVDNADAVKLRVDPESVAETLRSFHLEDDFGGRLYQTGLDGRDAVYVHREGAYTAEIRDEEDTPGAFRVNPDPDGEADLTIEHPRTGKASLADFLSVVSEETRREVAAIADRGRGSGTRGLLKALASVRDGSANARDRADAGEEAGADRLLVVTRAAIERLSTELERADLPPPVERAVRKRANQARRRVTQALQARE